MEKNPYERRMREQTVVISNLQLEVKKLNAKLAMKEKTIAAYREKNAFKALKGRPTMIVQIGSEAFKWLPSEPHFAAAQRRIKMAKLDEKYNILLTHALTKFTVQE